jgi:hypothetical protein
LLPAAVLHNHGSGLILCAKTYGVRISMPLRAALLDRAARDRKNDLVAGGSIGLAAVRAFAVFKRQAVKHDFA